jgi:hypothetical protein
MGRIIASVRIDSALDTSKGLICDAFVDPGTPFMVLPASWKNRFGELDLARTIEVRAANQQIIDAEVCGPVRIQIEGFRSIHTEVAFVEMKPGVGEFEPLLGHIVLTKSQAGIDTLGNRLIPIKYMDLKNLITHP